jgi:adenylate kinase family enzyme
LGNGSINIFGMPFSGKDTQGSILAEYFGGVMISSGDILRHDHGNKQIQEIMAEGGIIPSELFEQIVLPFLSKIRIERKTFNFKFCR